MHSVYWRYFHSNVYFCIWAQVFVSCEYVYTLKQIFACVQRVCGFATFCEHNTPHTHSLSLSLTHSTSAMSFLSFSSGIGLPNEAKSSPSSLTSILPSPSASRVSNNSRISWTCVHACVYDMPPQKLSLGMHTCVEIWTWRVCICMDIQASCMPTTCMYLCFFDQGLVRKLGRKGVGVYVCVCFDFHQHFQYTNDVGMYSCMRGLSVRKLVRVHSCLRA